MATRRIDTEIALSGEAEFNSAMKAMNNNLGVLKSDMKAVSAEFDDNADSTTALTEKQKILEATLDQQKAKQEAYAQRLQKVSAQYGENSALADKYRKALNEANVAVKKAEDAVKANAAELAKHPQFLGRASDAFAAAKKTVTEFGQGVVQAAKTAPVLGDAIFVAGKTAQAAGAAIQAAGKGIAVGIEASAKAAAALTAAGAAAVGAAGAIGVAGAKMLVGYAKEAADAAKSAAEAGEELSESQQAWLAFSDQLDGLDASVGGAKAALGGILMPLLGDLAGDGAQLLSDFTAEMNAAAGDTQKQGEIITKYVSNAAKLVRDKLPEFMSLAGTLLQGLGEGLIQNAPELLDDAEQLISTLLNGIIKAAPQLGDGAISLISMLASSLISQGPSVLEAGVRLVVDLVNGLAQSAPKLVPQAVALVVNLVNTLVSNAPLLIESGLQLILALLQGILEAAPQLVAAIPGIISNLVSEFADAWPQISNIGMDIVRGIWDGISNGYDWISGKISGWVSDVLAFLKGKLGIASPSKVMADQVGRYMAEGIGMGFEKEMSDVNKAIAGSIQTRFNIRPVVTGPGGFIPGDAAYSGGTQKIYNTTINATRLTQADLEMILEFIDQNLGRAA